MSETKQEKHCKDPFERSLKCHKCENCICERVYVINLALGYLEEFLCLKCIAVEKGLKDSDIFKNLSEYVYTRPCFKTDWVKIDPENCPKYPVCYCGEIND